MKVTKAILDRLAQADGYEPRHRDAGPAYAAIKAGGFTEPHTVIRAKIPSVKFRGTDAQLQEILDKSNEAITRRELQRPTLDEVREAREAQAMRMACASRLAQLEARLKTLDTDVSAYVGTKVELTDEAIERVKYLDTRKGA